MGSIRRHKNAMSALLAEFYDKPNNNLEFSEDFDDFSLTKKRREDEGNSAGGMCLSVVRYARPQKAKSASGEWKYIVNTGQHTQTLRLEKCSNPGESCSYLAQTYRSHCSQVYNYHRLLSWDKVRGLHVDIFKVPTCCSCQVDGYRQQFPPLSSIQAKDYSPLANFKPESVGSNGYSTINEEDLDYADDSEEDELGLGLRYPTFNGRDTNELYAGSKKMRASTSVGPYLSPPDDDVEEDQRYGGIGSGYKSSHHNHKGGAGASSKKYYSQVSRRRPHQHQQQQQQQQNEARVDLDLAPSEMHTDQEVNVNPFAGPVLSAGEKPIQRLPINRKLAPVPIMPPMPIKQPPQPPQHSLLHPQQLRHLSLPSTSVTTTSVGAGAVAVPPASVYHVNSIYTSSGGSSSSVDGASAGPSNGTKRINYNYHPIIDFFEKSSRRAEQTLAVTPGGLGLGLGDYDMEESRLMEQRRRTVCSSAALLPFS
ncbi:neurotrophin 1 [Drosophila persimilis]|uniref:neurotrophin 1 n=1 Tax=Drosophila persimilis TaxID=7234 RepID=UPI000F08D9A9|nr:neurotrophin 1 [Drosophila persimilis]